MGSLYIFTIAHHSLPGVVIKTDGAPTKRPGADPVSIRNRVIFERVGIYIVAFPNPSLISMLTLFFSVKGISLL